MAGYAWVTLTTNDSYSLGALVLAHSLKQAGTAHRLVVLVTPGVTNPMRQKLAGIFDVVEEVNVLDSKDEANLRLLKRPELGITFTKLHCWRLTQFEKCVFLDADTLVLKNADELFERDEFSAAPDVGWPDCFNSGVYVYRPSNETYDKLIQFALTKGSFDGGDQGLLNLYFNDWSHKDISRHLPFIYNMCSTACYSYLPAFKQFGTDAKIVHFIGGTKPWLQYFNSETNQVQPANDMGHLKEVLQKWWDIFCSLVHANLSSDMSAAPSFAHNIIDDYISCQPSEYGDVWDPWEDYVVHDDDAPAYAQPLTQCTDRDTHSQFESHNTNTLHDNTVSYAPASSSTFASPDLSLQSNENPPVPKQTFSAFPATQALPQHSVSDFADIALQPNESLLESDQLLSLSSESESPLLVSVNESLNEITEWELVNDNPEIPIVNNAILSDSSDSGVLNEESILSDPLCVPSHNIKTTEEQSAQNNEDGGLAGAFAQFSLGAPRPQGQDEIEDHLRRQSWEVGNIDYMGRDAFDKIWSKISETISATPETEAKVAEATATPTAEASPAVKTEEPEAKAGGESAELAKPKAGEVVEIKPAAEEIKPEAPVAAEIKPTETAKPDAAVGVKPEEVKADAVKLEDIKPVDSGAKPATPVEEKAPTDVAKVAETTKAEEIKAETPKSDAPQSTDQPKETTTAPIDVPKAEVKETAPAAEAAKPEVTETGPTAETVKPEVKDAAATSETVKPEVKEATPSAETVKPEPIPLEGIPQPIVKPEESTPEVTKDEVAKPETKEPEVVTGKDATVAASPNAVEPGAADSGKTSAVPVETTPVSDAAVPKAEAETKTEPLKEEPAKVDEPKVAEPIPVATPVEETKCEKGDAAVAGECKVEETKATEEKPDPLKEEQKAVEPKPDETAVAEKVVPEVEAKPEVPKVEAKTEEPKKEEIKSEALPADPIKPEPEVKAEEKPIAPQAEIPAAVQTEADKVTSAVEQPAAAVLEPGKPETICSEQPACPIEAATPVPTECPKEETVCPAKKSEDSTCPKKEDCAKKAGECAKAECPMKKDQEEKLSVDTESKAVTAPVSETTAVTVGKDDVSPVQPPTPEVISPTPPSTPCTAESQECSGLDAAAVVPDTPPPAQDSTGTPVPPPRKSSGGKKPKGKK